MADAFVVVIGLGGVGSHCAHMLLRSGVSRMRLVDFDQVSLSSLNRHAVATREDVGTSKASCLVSHFKKIYPEAVLEDRNVMYEKAVEDELLGDDPDFVVDCIDNIGTKVELLAACVRRGIPVLACGGAGAKCDPTRIRVVDIAESIADPLARAVRHRLTRDHGIESGINVIISTEKQRCELVRPRLIPPLFLILRSPSMMICACFDHHTNFCSNIPPGSSRSQRRYFDERLSSSAKLQNKDYSGVWSTPSDIWYGVCSTCCYSAGRAAV